jgi:hypothetical protein
MGATFPYLAFATPRKLPKPATLPGRVAVVDIAFAAEGTGTSFEKVTEPFIRGLGTRLVAWVDHHDHALHARFASDPRFVLATKREHGACPEMVTPELVARVGPVDAIACHVDLDGLYAAAKWIRGGLEPYDGADADARAVDTRIGTPSPRGDLVDRALRARPRDDALRGLIVRYLCDGATDAGLRGTIASAAAEFVRQEENARALAARSERVGAAAVMDATGFADRVGPYDKTLALLLGQERAPVSVLYDEGTVTLAAPFESGVDFLKLLGISGGMPTRVSVPRARLDEVLRVVERLAVGKNG